MGIRIGTISFQSNDRADVFSVLDVYMASEELSDEQVIELDESHFEDSKAWLNGNVPQMKVVDIDGDSRIIRTWFQGEGFIDGATIRIYLEYEEVEELLAVDATEDEGGGEACEDAREIFL